jgi:hypothetical protein
MSFCHPSNPLSASLSYLNLPRAPQYVCMNGRAPSSARAFARSQWYAYLAVVPLLSKLCSRVPAVCLASTMPPALMTYLPSELCFRLARRSACAHRSAISPMHPSLLCHAERRHAPDGRGSQQQPADHAISPDVDEAGHIALKGMLVHPFLPD